MTAGHPFITKAHLEPMVKVSKNRSHGMWYSCYYVVSIFGVQSHALHSFNEILLMNLLL